MGWCNQLLALQVICTSIILAASLTPDISRNMLNIRPIPEVPAEQQTMSNECFEAIANMTSANTIAALDALGKPGAGILAGNINMLGHFDECESIEGLKYCMTFFSVSQGGTQSSAAYGLCVPEECTENDIQYGYENFVGATGFSAIDGNATQVSPPMCTRYPHRPFDWKFALTVTFFSLLFLLVAGSSLYHAWYHSSFCQGIQYNTLNEQSKWESPMPNAVEHGVGDVPSEHSAVNQPPDSSFQEGNTLSVFHKIIFSFALPQNLPKLLSGKLSKDSIPCINGIRVISMLWVILGHTFFFIFPIAMMNPLTILSWLKRYGFLAVSNAFFSVDSFFFLSGLLVTYLTLKQMKKKRGRIPWHWFYFHRYWRLTPALVATMLFYVYIVPYFGHGPYAQAYSARPNCPKYWWTNMLYINNFYPTDGVDSCIGWVWYLANDMQFFVISPIILVPLYFLPVIGFSLIAVLCLGSIITTSTLTGIYDYPPGISGILNPNVDPSQPSFTDVIYYKPYCRITPYLVGMALGYILYKYPQKSIKMHWAIALAGWVVACGIGYTCIYSIYPNLQGHEWSPAGNAIYQGLCRFAWGLFLAWVVFACHYGYGGWVNSVLGYPAWAPLGRLTYTAYLLHPIVLVFYSSYQANVNYLSYTLAAFLFAGASLISYGCAAVFSLAVEFPLVSLEKLFIPRN